MAWIWTALMPHPPVMVPEVGKGREKKEAAVTCAGTQRLCDAITRMNQQMALPEILFVLSPHEPYVPKALFVNTAGQINGSLSRFGAPGVTVECHTSSESLSYFAEALKAKGLPVAYGEMEDISQDHGTIVPLHFLKRCFPNGKLPAVIIANPSGLTPEQAYILGGIMRNLPIEKSALLASGDLSHRLKEDGPYGFNPDGPVFDQKVVKALEQGSADMLLNLPQTIRENAGECGLRPILAMLGVCLNPVQVFSYEGPFGVGYCNALWHT